VHTTGEQDRTSSCRDIRAGKEIDALRKHAREKAADGDCADKADKADKREKEKKKEEERGEGQHGKWDEGGRSDASNSGKRDDGRRPEHRAVPSHDPSHQHKSKSGKKSSARE
jgi:hypothetical protein